MPALTKSRLGSSLGTSGALGTTVWPRSRKKSRKPWRISSPVTTACFYRLGSGPATRVAAREYRPRRAAASATSSPERARRPPRVEPGEIRARPEREARRALLEEGGHPLAGVGRAAHPVDRPRVDLVRLHRMVGAEHAPEELPGEGDGDRGSIVGDLACQAVRRREQIAGRHDAAHETARQRFLGAEHASRVHPLGGPADADDAREKPAAARL